MSSDSCNQDACNLCIAGMDVVSETVCDYAGEAVGAICQGIASTAGDDEEFAPIAEIIGMGCAAAIENGCKVESEISWKDKACTTMFGKLSCCGEAPTQSCGSCPPNVSVA